MFKRCPIYPIIPTSEAETLSFLQKLNILEYRLEKLEEKTSGVETALNEAIEQIGNSFETVNGDISALQGDISDINGDIRVITGSIETINNTLTGLGVVKQGTFNLADENENPGLGSYVMFEDKLIISFDDISALTGSTIGALGIPFDLADNVEITAEVTHTAYNLLVFTFWAGQIKITKPANTPLNIATISFANDGKILTITSGIVTTANASLTHFKQLQGQAITFNFNRGED